MGLIVVEDRFLELSLHVISLGLKIYQSIFELRVVIPSIDFGLLATGLTRNDSRKVVVKVVQCPFRQG